MTVVDLEALRKKQGRQEAAEEFQNPEVPDTGAERYKERAKRASKRKPSGVVSLAEHKREKTLKHEDRLAILTEDYPWFPDDYEIESRTSTARFNPEDWDRLCEFFQLFLLELPHWAHFEAILEAWDHLWESYGHAVRYKVSGPVTYRATTHDWTPTQHAFVDALIEGNEQRVRELGEELGFFAEVKAILGRRDIVRERRPAIILDGLPEALARQVAPPGWEPPPKPPKAPKTPRRPRKAGPPKLRVID
ncbi:hypothetical protein [Burkholderia ubonensis]|uniref:hypothetical protein n=1 Tax=Burkholderia ubonensis TaxID=101571 RepID=UPI00075734AF|nr:hypothetical protein [Burkholderia ubonensis]KVD69881.1 hypothetical protein WI88_31020 [Burkholderia ubonensis]